MFLLMICSVLLRELWLVVTLLRGMLIVSEKGFSFTNGMALLPAEGEEGKLWKEEVQEAVVTQESRQKGFDDQTTTDDHLMHITGLAMDQSGNKYFVIKNSWGQDNLYGGHQYISMAYFRAKTIAVLVNNEAVVRSLKAPITRSHMLDNLKSESFVSSCLSPGRVSYVWCCPCSCRVGSFREGSFMLQVMWISWLQNTALILAI